MRLGSALGSHPLAVRPSVYWGGIERGGGLLGGLLGVQLIAAAAPTCQRGQRRGVEGIERGGVQLGGLLGGAAHRVGGAHLGPQLTMRWRSGAQGIERIERGGARGAHLGGLLGVQRIEVAAPTCRRGGWCRVVGIERAGRRPGRGHQDGKRPGVQLI